MSVICKKFFAPLSKEVTRIFIRNLWCVLSKQSFLFLLLLICCGYANYSAQGAFVIIFFTCSDLLNCLRSICNVAIRTRQHQSHLHEKKSSLQAAIFAVLMYSLYGHPRNFKFKQKYQQNSPLFQTILPFLMTMVSLTSNSWLLQSKTFNNE